MERGSDPADGSEVTAGQGVTVRMAWPADDFADVPLHNVLVCVTVDGEFAEALSVNERNAPNAGEFTHRFTVPAGLATGTEICHRGAVAGDGNGYFELNKTPETCYTVAEGSTPPVSPPAVQPPAPAGPPAPTPAEVAPAEVAPAEVQGVTLDAPAPQALAAPAPLAQLPRTGRQERALLTMAGLMLAAGGCAIIASARRASPAA